MNCQRCGFKLSTFPTTRERSGKDVDTTWECSSCGTKHRAVHEPSWASVFWITMVAPAVMVGGFILLMERLLN